MGLYISLCQYIAVNFGKTEPKTSIYFFAVSFTPVALGQEGFPENCW